MERPQYWLYTLAGGCSNPGAQQCYLCARACNDDHPVAGSIAETFNSHAYALCRSSSFLCDACAWYLDNKAGHEDYRKMSLVVMRDAWRNWPRAEMQADIERWLTHGLDTDAYLIVSLTKKKHLLLQAPVNAAVCPGSGLAVQVEEQRAFFRLEDWQAVAHPFRALLALGHGKGEILSGNLYANTLRKHGQVREAMTLNQRLAPWRGGALMELYSYTTLLEGKETQQDDGFGRGDDEHAGSGDATPGHSRATASRGLEVHRPGVQEQVPRGNLAAIRGANCRGSADDGQSTRLSQSSLWDASDC